MMRDSARGDEDAAVAFLRSWSGDGPALELGIGTGRDQARLADCVGPDGQVVGIDLAKPAHHWNRTRGWRRSLAGRACWRDREEWRG